MTIEYFKKSVYGNDMLYIKDAKQAETIRVLTGKKTIDARDIEMLSRLGITFKQVIN